MFHNIVHFIVHQQFADVPVTRTRPGGLRVGVSDPESIGSPRDRYSPAGRTTGSTSSTDSDDSDHSAVTVTGTVGRSATVTARRGRIRVHRGPLRAAVAAIFRAVGGVRACPGRPARLGRRRRWLLQSPPPAAARAPGLPQPGRLPPPGRPSALRAASR